VSDDEGFSLFDAKAAKELVRQAKAAPPPTVAETMVEAAVTGDRTWQDFRVFLFRLWKELGLPDPTEVQYDIARYMQIGPERSVVLGFRGVAKSWIAGAYCLWTLGRNPQANILVVSGSAAKAVAFVNFCLGLIRSVSWLRWLEPKANQRQSSTAFDVAPALPDQNPSLYSLGINSQLQGWRADLIVPDDIETTKNSMTPPMRDKLKELIKELDSIVKPGGRILYLGTPQSEASIYNSLPERGYSFRIWPCFYPTVEERRIYGGRLAPKIRTAVEENAALIGTSTDPSRFPDEDLRKRQLSYGKTGFARQFMLITEVGDAERHPLRLHDLIVMSLDPRRGPDSVSWSKDRDFVRGDLPMLGRDGDYFVRPASVSETTSPYEEIIASIDPSGRGNDEAAMVVLGRLNSRVFLLKLRAWLNGYAEETLRGMSRLCVEFGVQRLYIESNFGGGMFGALLRPHLTKAWDVANRDKAKVAHGATEIIEEPAPKTQKEVRMADTLEPITQQHRLVVAAEVIEDDYKAIMAMDAEDTRKVYSLVYQMAYLTRERDSLVHDDRLDALASGVARWVELFSLDPDSLANDRDIERVLEQLQGFQADLDALQGTSYRPASGRRPHLGVGRRNGR
jgi:hypothetical protein